jgi:hypothetical protein
MVVGRPVNVRQKIIRLATFLGGLYFFVEFVMPPTVGGFQIDKYHEPISNGFVVVGAMAVGLGIINLLAVHGTKVAFLKKQWVNSLALLIGLFLMMAITFNEWRSSEQITASVARVFRLRDFSVRIKSDFESAAAGVPSFDYRNMKLREAGNELLAQIEREGAVADAPSLGVDHPDRQTIQNYRLELQKSIVDCRLQLQTLTLSRTPSADDLAKNEQVAAAFNGVALAWQELANLVYKYTSTRKSYEFLYEGLFVSLGSAMFSLLGFYIAAAAYRAFRVRSVESALMMGAALLVMMGQIPFGVWLWEGFPDVRLWLLTTPSSAAFRAVKIGAEVAALVIAFRMWFSIESNSFGKE